MLWRNGPAVRSINRMEGVIGKTVKAIAGVVIGVALAVAAPYLVPVIAGALSVSTFVATAIVAVGLAVVAYGVNKLLKPSMGTTSSRDAAPSIFRQSITESFIVYGRRRVGGLLVFFHPRVVGSDHYRYFVIACAGHRCAGNPTFVLGDEIVTVNGSNMVTSGKYANAAWLWFQRGLASETANATFVSECGGKWTSAHKGNGVAAIYAKFKMTDAVIQAGMPNITAIIDGKDDIHDYRDDSDDNFTANSALVFYDWMQLPREEGGFGAYPDEIPDDTWIAAQANVCDENVSLAAGGTEKRYELNAYITTGGSPADVREQMVLNCAGSFACSGGVFFMRPGYYVAQSHTLSEDNLVSAISVSAFDSDQTAANRVEGTFVDPSVGYQGQPFPARTSGATDVRQMDVDFAMLTSGTMAQRVANIMLNRALADKSVTWPCNIAELDVSPLDTVGVDTTRYSLDNYAFQVRNWSLSADYGIVLSLREENADIYTWSTADEGTIGGSTPDAATAIETVAQASAYIRYSQTLGLTITGTDAGSDASIIVSSHTRDYTDKVLSVDGDTITSLDYETAYGIYYDDITRSDTSPTYFATEDYNEATNTNDNPGRHFIGRVTTPAMGAGDTTGESGLSPGGGTAPSGCATDDAMYLLANATLDGPGDEIAGADLAVGMMLWTFHPVREIWGAYRLHRVVHSERRVWTMDAASLPQALEGVEVRDLTTSRNHRYAAPGGEWFKNAGEGTPDGTATISQITVEDAQTSVINGVLSHNLKSVYYEY